MSLPKIELWTNQEIQKALGLSEESLLWSATGISIDTRTLKPGDLYIAIKGENHDGHSFVTEAFNKGAVAAIVDHVVEDENKIQICVEDTLKALSQLGSFARQRTKATIIAVTGSVGKTSTKELLKHVMKAFGVTYASPASFNNHWGVPLSLASMPRDALFGIFEMGMNHRGEISPLAAMARPHIGVITTISDAHIGYMGSRTNIVEEKADIFSSAPAPSLAVINQDIPEFDHLRDCVSAFGVPQLIGFGKSEKAAVRMLSYDTDSTALKGIIKACVAGQSVVYTLPQPGEHIAMNSLIALALGEALGLDQSKVIAQLETLPAVKGRGMHHYVSIPGGQILLIDDAYNANLTSMQAGLSVLASLPVSSSGRRLSILGEMLELGDQAESLHHQLMEEVLSHPIDLIFATGGPVVETAFKKTIPPEKAGGYANTVDVLTPMVLDALRPGDIVFVKGSKGSRVSQVVDTLLSQHNLQDRMN